MPVGLPNAVVTFGPIRAAVALSVFMFGMLAGADIAARVMPPVQDDGAAAYLLHLLPSAKTR
jgi:hypothetical protein